MAHRAAAGGRHSWSRRGAVIFALLLGAGAVLWGVAELLLARLPPLSPDLRAERSTVVLDRHGRLLRAATTSEGRWRLPVSRGEVDPRYLALLKLAEDQRFDRHGGIDVAAILRAAWQNLRAGRTVSGGSTLSMQVARLLEPRPERSLADKLRQAAQAIQLERREGKARILDLYLALAPFGGNLEGVRAASLAYFGREPARLGLAEAALLVALPQAPELRRPDRFPEAARRARDRVLARAARAGLATAEEVAKAKAEPVPRVRIPLPVLAPHLAERVMAEAPLAREHRLTLDARWQADLERLARERAIALGPRLSVAIVVIETATGALRASVGGADYFAAERAGSLDLTRTLRSPGSALKPFIYGLAFEQGTAHPETMLEDRPQRFGAYAPDNFDRSFSGLVTARTALQASLNVPAVDLLAAVGPQRLLARLRAGGATVVLPRESGAAGLAVGLGGVGISLADLVRLYAAVARGGEDRAPFHREGEAGAAAIVMEPLAAWYVADILHGAPPPAHAPAHRIAHKTGTSYGYRDAWAVGFDGRHTIGVWIGRPDHGAVPGLLARHTAAPLLFEAFGRIGIDPTPPRRPEGALSATTARLPPPLRHLRQDVPKLASAIIQPRLRLAFPPAGASIDLAAMAEGGEAVVQLKALGGTPPFTWLVDGVPLGPASPRREALWRPEGAGFTTLAVIDARGESESTRVRLLR